MDFRLTGIISMRRATLIGVAVAIMVAPSMVHAGADDADEASVTATIRPDATEVLSKTEFPARTAVRALIEKETAATGLPPDIAEAVVFVESRYDSTVIGSVGEVGLMQVRPGTAAMLGFRGTTAELAEPETNIHYGVIYLARAWRLAQGDLCRAVMKYRAGHGEETMTPRSVIYCNRARNRLVAMNSPFALPGAIVAMPPEPKAASLVAAAAPIGKPDPLKAPGRDADVYAIYRQGTPAASRAFWTTHEARIRVINAQLERRWRSASR